MLHDPIYIGRIYLRDIFILFGCSVSTYNLQCFLVIYSFLVLISFPVLILFEEWFSFTYYYILRYIDKETVRKNPYFLIYTKTWTSKFFFSKFFGSVPGKGCHNLSTPLVIYSVVLHLHCFYWVPTNQPTNFHPIKRNRQRERMRNVPEIASRLNLRTKSNDADVVRRRPWTTNQGFKMLALLT